MHRSKTNKPNNDNNNNNKPYYKQPEHPAPEHGWNVNGHGSNNNQPPAPGWNINGQGSNNNQPQAPGWNVNGQGSNNNNQFYNKPTQKSGLIRYIRIKLFRAYFISWRT